MHRASRIVKKPSSISWYIWIGAVAGAIIAIPLFGWWTGGFWGGWGVGAGFGALFGWLFRMRK